MAEDEQIEALRQSLREQIENVKAKLASMQKAYDALTPENSETRRFSSVRVWIATRQYLQEVGRADMETIVDALRAGGANLGKYPLRTVKISLTSRSMKNLFKIEEINGKEFVSLKEGKGSGPKKPLPQK